MKVKERLRQIPDSAQGGSLLYFVLIQLIQTNGKQAVRIITVQLEKFLLKTLSSGENIFTACSLIQELWTI
jgi:hypothetical protein